MSDGYNGWNQPLMVTLTATTNSFLTDKLPLRGLLQVLEMATTGFAQNRQCTFQQVDDEGNLVGTTVAVDDAEFTYTLPPARA